MTRTWKSQPDWTTIVDGVLLMPSDAERARVAHDVDRWDSLIIAKATKYGIPSALIKGVMCSESWGDPNIGSDAGALGLMQVMPFHFPAGWSRAQMCDPDANVDKGASLLADAIRRVGQDVPKIAACYNAGGVYADQGKWYDARDDWGFRQNHFPGTGRAYATNVVTYTNYLVSRSSGAPTAPAADGGVVTVEVLGDSLAQGLAPELAKLLPAYVRLVGRTSAAGARCEAYPGFSITMVGAKAREQACPVADVTVSIVGTNDVAGVGGNWTVADMATHRGTFVDDVHARGSIAQVLVGISPIARADLAARSQLVAPYNAAQAAIAAARRAIGWPVAYVDPQVSVTELYDGVHGGFATMARAVAAKLVPMLGEIRRQRAGGDSSGLAGGLVMLAGLAIIAWALTAF